MFCGLILSTLLLKLLQVWERVVKEKLPFAVILEDDAKLAEDFTARATVAIHKHLLNGNYDLLYLGNAMSNYE